MKSSSRFVFALVSVFLFAAPSLASEFFIYPNKGQSKDQHAIVAQYP